MNWPVTSYSYSKGWAATLNMIGCHKECSLPTDCYKYSIRVFLNVPLRKACRVFLKLVTLGELKGKVLEIDHNSLE